jgi:hypothetical protein
MVSSFRYDQSGSTVGQHWERLPMSRTSHTVGSATTATTPHWPLGAVLVVAAVYGVSAAGYLLVLLGEVTRRSPAGLVGALTSGAQLFPLCESNLGPLAFGGMTAVLGMSAAFGLAAASTLAGTAVLAAPHRLFATAFCERGGT